MPSTGLRRRADLSGAQGVVGRSEPAFLVVAADASGSVKDGVGAVRVDMHLDPRLDEMGPHRAFGDLKFERPVETQLSLPTCRSSSTHRISSRSTPGTGVKAEPSPAGRTAKRALWAGR